MYEKFLKRFLDLIFALFSLPVVILLFLIFGAAIKIEDGGPIFYKDKRIGKHGKVFIMYKFRTMKVNSKTILNEDGSTYNSKTDPRLTRIGSFLRETSLDEVPQIINVLQGNMSLIGPRPSMEIAAGSFKEDEIAKMEVLPGITGYNQAYYRNTISNREKRLNDAWYARNISFKLDFKILVKTINSVLKRENIYTNER